MPVDATEQDGRQLIAVNWDRGHPWHRLGEVVDHDMELEEALKLVGVEDEWVRVVPIFGQDPPPEDDDDEEFSGEYETLSDAYGVYSNVFGYISVAGNRWHPTQRRAILETAYDIVGLSHGEARIDTIGNLGERGDTFFAYIRVPDLVIDPGGIADEIERGLFVATSFNLTLKNVFGYSNIRPVCRNTVNMALGQLQQTIQVKHTKYAEERINQAAIALKYAGAVEAETIRRAEQMLKVEGKTALPVLLDHFWGISDESLSERQKNKRARIREHVRELYWSNTNVQLVGDNGWAAYNAVVEYLDHDREVRGANKTQDKARAAVLPGKVVNDKVKASELVLDLSMN